MKIMIVDDEVIIRNGLCTVIDWKELGLDLIPPAASAEEALERIPDEKPDILLTDIRMTGMDGIELMKEVKRMLPDTEVIILSGFDDFAYVQQALRGGVTDYLLKTSRPEEIIKAALKAKQNILDKRELLKQEKRQRNELNRQTLMKLLSGGMPDACEDDLDPIRDWLSVQGESADEIDEFSMRVMIVSASGWGDKRFEGLLIGAVDNIISELLTCMTLPDRERLIVVLREEAGASDDSALARELRRIGQILKCETFAALGRSVSGCEQLPASFAEADRIYSFKGLIGASGLFSSEHLKSRTGGRTLCSGQEESELSALLMSNDATGLRHWTNQTVRAVVEDPAATPSTLQAYLHSVVIAGHRWLERTRAGESAPGDLSAPSAAVYDWGGRPEDEVFRSLSAIMAAYHQSMDRSRFSYIRKAIDYIREHLDQPLSLQQVAGFVHSNPNHFSEVFKRETGMTYLEFVTQERMRKAAELLHGTPIKVADIANRVGYTDIKYFTQQFKKHTGKTPSEYRQSPKEAEG